MNVKPWFGALAVCTIACSAAVTAADVHVGGLCDRTGPTQNIGVELCRGAVDYFALVNRMGGVDGHKLVYTELDHAYQPNRAVEGYGQLRKQGIVALLSYGVPTLYALRPHLMADKIPAFSTGTGPSGAIDGKAWPYIFPGTASYWSQAGAAMKFLKDSGVKKGARIAMLYLDNVAGQEAIPMVEAVARKEGYVLRRFAVPTPGFEMESQVQELTRSFKADWVITSLFSGSPTVSIREFRKAGFPLNRVIAFVYGTGDNDVEEAGWDNAEGYLGLQYAFVGRDVPLIQDIIKMYRDERKEVPAYLGGVYYNRGLLNAAVIVEAVRLAIRQHGMPLTGDKVRLGFEAVKGFDLNGLIAPITITPGDHEGGGYLRVYQVNGKAWVPVSGWIRDYRDEVMTLVKEENAKR